MINQDAKGIGQRITKSRQTRSKSKIEPLTIESLELKIVGVAFSFGKDCTSYYLSLTDDIKKHAEANDTIAPASQDDSISLETKLDLIQMALKTPSLLAIYDLKSCLKLLHLGLGLVQLEHDKYFDPKVAAWMLKPGENEMTLAAMVMNFRPDLAGILDTLGSSR